MESIVYGMEMEGGDQTIFTSNETTQINRENFMAASSIHGDNEAIPTFSRRAPFHSSGNNDLFKYMQKEQNSGEISSTNAEMGEPLNFNTNGTEIYEDPVSNFYTGVNQPNSGSWNDRSGHCSERTINETFDFLVKSLLSANNFVSLLSREQIEVLRSISPSLLCALLQEVAKLRSDRRIRRAAPNECAFCKNNGENEEHYSSHALKDGRGRVLCPVLRAFRCPRCGATGDRAHTIKYCPESVETGSDRSSNLSWRRQASMLTGQSGPSSTGTGRHLFTSQTRSPSPAPSAITMPTSAVWSGFGLN
ncbi:hypothetical protein K1T71_007903 [Dendrolimus kikuchii]|uniref:Uncharacterized protein n=1 Tax=Dendrolimus kikuchii TaxID=765133 RepID=A0ACC1CZ30_9NEOP|nr:hypothetical protein K1T71_007903 [Dendrolimus kikuchii]